jgi:hypothetical protein
MQKVYLLLRNNQQTGPFTVDELLQHNLKSTDLVWEEGRSFGWSYPHEINSLKSFFHAETPLSVEKNVIQNKSKDQELLSSDMDAPFASKSVTSKNVYVSLPHESLHREDSHHESIEETLEQKAEAIRRRALASIENGTSNTIHKSLEEPYELETKLARTTSEIGEDYSAWLYTQQIEKKKKARRRKSFLMGVSTVFLLATGFFFYKGMITSSDTVTVETPPQLQENKKEDVVPVKTQQPQNIDEVTTTEESAELADSENKIASMATLPVKKGKVAQKPTSSQAYDSQKVVGLMTNSGAKVDTNAETAPLQDVDSELIKKEKVASEVAEAPKKKESFGSKIGNFFEKFKSKEKRDKPVNNETKTEQTQEESGAKRKQDQASPPINLANFISVSSNAPSENWMMGVQGLKLTLHNKSNETIKNAAVEIRYYNEDKELLEKKVVYFNNVSAKTTQTVAAPDHRLAESADYQLISAIPKEDGYVKQ